MTEDIFDKLKDALTDYDGSQIPDDSEPRWPIKCEHIRDVLMLLDAAAQHARTLNGLLGKTEDVLRDLMESGTAVITAKSRWAPEEAECYTRLRDAVNNAREILDMEPIP